MNHPLTLKDALCSAIQSEDFRQLPLSTRSAFLSARNWLQIKAEAIPLISLTAALVRNWRSQAARERGWRHGNSVLRLVQLAIAIAIEEGSISKNRVRNIALLPPQWPKSDRSRRHIDALSKRTRCRNHPRANGAFGRARSAASCNSHLGTPDEPPIS